jgi:hypothetical protein
MRVPLWAALLCCVPALAWAGTCGDSVRGRVVPCACGDVLVGSRTLDDTDPITRGACPGRGLLVVVPPDVRGAVLALGGRSIRGRGHGVGVQVMDGGSGGLTLRGPGTVQDFAIGVLAAAGALGAAEDVVVTGNRSDGFRVAGSGFALRGCEATRNGGDGFALRGDGFTLDGSRAVGNRRRGFAVAGRTGQVGTTLGNEALRNGAAGFAVRGREHRVRWPVATANGGAGIVARGTAATVADAVASENRRAGVRARGGGIAVRAADARDNGGVDVDVRGRGSCRDAGCR